MMQVVIKFLSIVLITVGIPLCTLSCCDNKEAPLNVELLLMGDSIKYWTSLEKSKIFSSEGILFNDFNKLNYHSLDSSDNGRRILFGGVRYDRWRLVSSNLLYTDEDGFLLIEYLSEDLLVLNSFKLEEILVYKKALAQDSLPAGYNLRYRL